MRWNQGRATVDKLIADGELQRVPPSREHADQLLAQARKDMASAELLRDSNPKRAYESLYDGARMALVAVLENRAFGQRPAVATSRPTRPSQPSSTRQWARSLGHLTACGGPATGPSIHRSPHRM
jgi:hypothetical protein